MAKCHRWTISSRCIAVATYFDGLLDTSTSSTYLPLLCIVADIWNCEFSITKSRILPAFLVEGKYSQFKNMVSFEDAYGAAGKNNASPKQPLK